MAQFTCEISLVDKLDLTNGPNSVYVAKFDYSYYQFKCSPMPRNNQTLEKKFCIIVMQGLTYPTEMFS